MAGEMKKHNSNHCGMIENESYWEAQLEHFNARGTDESLETRSVLQNNFVEAMSNPFGGIAELLRKDVLGSVFSDGFRPV